MRRLVSFIILSVLSCVLVVSPMEAQARSYFWDRWDTVIDQIDTTANTFRVRELYTYVLSGTFRFGFAEIPLDRVTDITDVQVYQNGTPLTPGCSEQPGTFCSRQRSGVAEIDFFFLSPQSDTSVDIELRYQVRGALRSYENGDQLWWFAVAPDHDAPIRNSVVVVNMPEGAVPRVDVDPVVTYGVPTEVDVCQEFTCAGVDTRTYIDDIAGAVVVARATDTLNMDEPLEIRVQFPHNPAMAAPPWQAEFDRSRVFDETVAPLLNLGVLGLSLLVGVGGPLAMIAVYYTRGRDPRVGPVPEHLPDLPSDLPPAMVGTLLDERAEMRDILSTLIDLARRGYLVIEEDRERTLFIVNTEFTFKRTNKPLDDLRPFEMRLIRAIFSNSDERSLDSLKNKFYRHIPKLKEDLYFGLVSAGLFPRSPETTRNLWTGAGVVLLVLGVVLFFLVLGPGLETFFEEGDIVPLDIPLLPLIGLAVGLNGLIMMIFANFMPAKTRNGAIEAAKWQAFRRYLQNLDRYDGVEAAAERFDAYLPYAVAFGIDQQWIRQFRGLDRQPIPAWYYPRYAGRYWSRGYRTGSNPPMIPSSGRDFSLDDMSEGMAGGLNSLSDGLTNMLNSASTVMNSRPQSSSGSWSRGGGGFSGGGGGSFGGGGGGSRGLG